jgi:ribonuclease HII
VFVVGVDENGLGPLLGPLVTTAVTLEVARYQPDRHGDIGRELGIDDSKATAGFGQMGMAEGLALAVYERLWGHTARDVDALFEGLLLDRPSALRGHCPSRSEAQCWSVQPALPCLGGDPAHGHEILRRLAARGVRLVHVRSALACTGTLNRLLRAGQSRVEVDLELMERLVLDARQKSGADVRAICGMVGGIRNYPDKMRHLRTEQLSQRRAQGGTLAFDVSGLGHLRFEIDADARHLPVALASMIGKYVRELWMERQNRFYRGHEPTLEEVSGYHDPVTQRFVSESARLRRRLGIEEDCFSRRNLKQLA